MADPKRLTGPCGWAQHYECPPDARAAPTSVTTWLMHLPNQGVGYSHFQLGVVSLQHIPGWPLPHRKYPEAEYELIVFALNPERNPVPDDHETWQMLEPVNVVEQFHGVSRAQAAELGELAAKSCVEGLLAAETQMYVKLYDGSPPKMMTIKELRDQWTRAVRKTVEHYKTFGLHERVN